MGICSSSSYWKANRSSLNILYGCPFCTATLADQSSLSHHIRRRHKNQARTKPRRKKLSENSITEGSQIPSIEPSLQSDVHETPALKFPLQADEGSTGYQYPYYPDPSIDGHYASSSTAPRQWESLTAMAPPAPQPFESQHIDPFQLPLPFDPNYDNPSAFLSTARCFMDGPHVDGQVNPRVPQLESNYPIQPSSSWSRQQDEVNGGVPMEGRNEAIDPYLDFGGVFKAIPPPRMQTEQGRYQSHLTGSSSAVEYPVDTQAESSISNSFYGDDRMSIRNGRDVVTYNRQ